MRVKIIPLVAVVLLAVTQTGCLTYRASRYAVRRGREAARTHAEARREAREASDARDANSIRDSRDSRDLRDDRRTDADYGRARATEYDRTGAPLTR